MSQRLKLNAIHFATSLDNEKALLDTSTLTLESKPFPSAVFPNAAYGSTDSPVCVDNLASTRTSKKQLGVVSKKGRGTTCLTIGVVVLVIVIFVWTYLLIKFT